MPVSQIVTNSIASGQTITSPVFAGTPTGVGVLTAATAQASTSGTSIDFTGIPSWVRRITVLLNGVSTNGASNLLIQIGSGAVLTSGYLGSSVGVQGASPSAGASYTTGFGISTANAANILIGSMVIANVSGNIWLSNATVANSTSSIVWVSGGNVSLSGTLDRLRVTTVNGTDLFDAGTINILYE